MVGLSNQRPVCRAAVVHGARAGDAYEVDVTALVGPVRRRILLGGANVPGACSPFVYTAPSVWATLSIFWYLYFEGHTCESKLTHINGNVVSK